ncbi:legumain-like [Uloborus diversus]|uniref:legumain-like n=1 Tax=Uloborus diversus TaxID=327109 RepID=UPI00240A2C5C|nr:legumain-like [Uloborus diversus]
MFSFVSLTALLVFISGVNSNILPKLLRNPAEGKLWAVLVAGSDGWDNYRHQADICHSYQVLHNHGIPDERIIVLMKDDLATNEENPTPGVVINHPKGKDVYKGVPHDYTGNDVTPENFMAVLKGDKQSLNGVGSGKVLESGPNDHVFVYFADHGAPGLIAFPESELTARQLNKTINYMSKHKKYGKMVIYIEACESGSMFENLLPDNINVYATTAANSEESSYACYYDEQRDTYLGDTYSVKWMEDSDKEELTVETLYQQFKIVKKEVNESHVQEFGDMKIAKMHVSEFQGRKSSTSIVMPKVPLNSVRSRDVPLERVKRRFARSNSVEEQSKLLKKLNKMIRNRNFLSEKVSDLVTEIFHDDNLKSEVLHKHYPLKSFECYDKIRSIFNEECFQISKNPYALDFMYVLVNLCEKKISPSRIESAMERVCVHPPVHGIL